MELTAALPAFATNVKPQVGKGSCSVNGQQVLCRIGVLAANEQTSASITLTGSGIGQLSATLAAHERDPAATDNSVGITMGPPPPAHLPPSPGGGGGGGALALNLLLALSLLRVSPASGLNFASRSSRSVHSEGRGPPAAEAYWRCPEAGVQSAQDCAVPCTRHGDAKSWLKDHSDASAMHGRRKSKPP